MVFIDDAAQQWISVSERLPEVPEERPYYGASTCVLITVVAESDQETPIKPYVTVAHLTQFKSEEPSWIACACSVIGYCDDLNEWKLEQVSHWMPLPQPPKGEI
jgi:hypothetical protein